MKREYVSLSVYPPIVARQRLGKHVPVVRDVFFYAVRVVFPCENILVKLRSDVALPMLDKISP
jgi:hypothetical protein